MRYAGQLGIILLVTFIGELLGQLIPLPIPAGIYGLVLLFLALRLKLIRLEQIEETADFLIEIMILTFIPATVGLMESWAAAAAMLIPAVLSVTVVTALVMGVSGWTTQKIIREEKRVSHE